MFQRSNDKLQDALVNLAKSVKSLVGQIRKNCSNAAQQLSPKTPPPPPPKSPKAAAGKGEAAKWSSWRISGHRNNAVTYVHWNKMECFLNIFRRQKWLIFLLIKSQNLKIKIILTICIIFFCSILGINLRKYINE